MRNKKSDYGRTKHNRTANKRSTIKRRKNGKRKLFMKRIFIVLLFLSLIGLITYGILFCLNSVFCVREISVEGNTMYSDKEILDVSGFNTGDGMLFLNTDNAEKRLYKSFGYIDSVKIHKELPDKLKISIDTAERTFAIHKEDGYYVISANDRLIEITPELPSEIIELRGMEFEVDENGKITYTDEDLKELMLKIKKEFSDSGLNSIKSIDMADANNLIVIYDARIKIILGSEKDLHYKVITTKEILSNKINQFEQGTLDLSALSEENKSYFTPEQLEGINTEG